MIISSYNHTVFSWIYWNYKYVLSVEKYGILVTIHNSICFQRLMKEFYTIFDYKL